MFPNGNYDPKLGAIRDRDPAISAEACFQDLIATNKLSVEKVYWTPQNETQCAPGTPDENGILEAGENCWDYIVGLNTSSKATLPLAFEASDGGKAKTWSKDHGHPWEHMVVIGFVDGSAEKANLNAESEVKGQRDGNTVDLCLPTPGINGWPETAKLAPATPAKSPTQ